MVVHTAPLGITLRRCSTPYRPLVERILSITSSGHHRSWAFTPVIGSMYLKILTPEEQRGKQVVLEPLMGKEFVSPSMRMACCVHITWR